MCAHSSSVITPQAGFTLIEALATVVIVGILSAVAVPQYRDYITRGRIPEATTALAGKQIQLEQYFQDNRTYIDAPSCTADTSSSQYFDFTCTNLTATTFTLTATGKKSMAGFKYTVNQAGAKSTAEVPTGWSPPSPNNCWATMKGGSC